jgi:uncharacterized protein YbbC (DUF1343 family)
MTTIWIKLILLLLSGNLLSSNIEEPAYQDDIIVGAERFSQYEDLLKGKRVAIVGNQSSLVGETHLLDTLLSKNINVVKVFTPEHGFRGKADAGAWVKSDVDEKTGVPLVSMYGKNKKPSSTSLTDVDVIIFDIQDVGARFYTYISSMHYVMEAAAENDKEVLILDRPNPNGHYVDGPVLDMKYKSFIGMHPVPVVHGMTIGEFAQMINEEAWLEGKVKCKLTVVPCENYTHKSFYKLKIKPSPNLPNMSSIYLYPSLCLFEGTTFSVGRGTDKPFQIVGAPQFDGVYTFTPEPTEGAKNPKHKGVECSGYDLSSYGKYEMRELAKFNFKWIYDIYHAHEDKANFFKSSGSFKLLCGTDQLQKMLVNGKSLAEIEASWKDDVKAFKETRKKYLLYPDFE